MRDQLWNPTAFSESREFPEREIVCILCALVYAHNWNDARLILDQQQAVLLTPSTLAELHNIIDVLRKAGQAADADNWDQYPRLLEETANSGIDSAWKHFMQDQNAAFEALVELTTAYPTDEIRHVLIGRKDALLTPAALVMLRDNIGSQWDAGNTTLARRFEALLQLLDDARVFNIAIAWNRFCNS